MQEALRVPEVSVLTRTPLRSPFRTSLANFKGGSPVIIGTTEDLNRELQAGRPVIVGLARATLGGGVMAHDALVVGINRGRDEVLLLDPDGGGHRRELADFRSFWVPTRGLMIVAMLPGR